MVGKSGQSIWAGYTCVCICTDIDRNGTHGEAGAEDAEDADGDQNAQEDLFMVG